MGVEAIIAASGEEAVKFAAEENLDIVLMDINMPGIDGYEATRRIRGFRNAGDLPIVALSAFASPAERRLAEECGMSDFQTKPIERDELAKALNTWLKAKPHALSSKIEPTVDAPFNPVDHAVLENLVSQIGYANLHTVMNKFFNELEGRWQAIENARNNDDLSREAHTLASTCSSFGLPSVAEKLACIERQARFGDADDPPSIAETGQELKLGAKALMSALEEYRTQP
jgi:CheY-like chemotaxis protein/HPt (histidine-containing phosphotransfer) domain-containing protein